MRSRRSKRVVVTHRTAGLEHLRCEWCGALWGVEPSLPEASRKCPERGFHALFSATSVRRHDRRDLAP